MRVVRDAADTPPGDAGIDDSFALDRDDDSWLDQCRRSRDGPAPTRLGAYVLMSEAGSGAQGRVYKAKQPGTGRVVAIKRLGGGRFATPSMRIRFEREVRALSSLSHPGVVTVFGADEVDGQPVLLMEWIDGAPIDAWARGKPLAERLAVFASVCDAVRHAHQRGVIHRDLKPSNILVDTAGQPRVLDFGLAKLLEEEDAGASALAWTRTTAFVGTPAYAAPEQISGAPDAIDTRTDVYALGVILYELLTGALPIARKADLPAMFDAIRLDEPRRPSALDPSLGAELDAIALMALAKEPERRYQSVDALSADVRRYLAGDTVLAHPPSAAYHLRKLVRRHRAAVAVAAAMALLVIAGTAATAWQAIRATRAETATARERDAARTEARRAEAVRDFLTEMLAEARPDRTGSSTLTVREAVDRAAARLDAGALKDQPEVEDAVRATLGRTYTWLSIRPAAARQYEWVVAYRERALGPRSPALGDALYWLGCEYEVIGERRRSQEALERSLRIYKEFGRGQFAPKHVLLALGELYGRNDPARAVRVFRDLVDELEGGGRGGDRNELAWALFGLARAYRDQGRNDESIAAYQKARPLVEREFGPIALHRIMFYRFYCPDVLYTAGRNQEIVEILAPLLAAAQPSYGAEHSEITRIKASLARSLIDLGRAAEAEPLLRENLVVLESTLQPDSMRVLVNRSLLGHALDALGRDDEAEPLLVAAFEGFDAHPAPNAVERDRALERVIQFYERRGRTEEAETYRARTGDAGVPR